jgi:hypothetical protein
MFPQIVGLGTKALDTEEGGDRGSDDATGVCTKDNRGMKKNRLIVIVGW